MAPLSTNINKNRRIGNDKTPHWPQQGHQRSHCLWRTPISVPSDVTDINEIYVEKEECDHKTMLAN